MTAEKKNKNIKKRIVIIAAIVVAVIAACAIYLGTYYPASDEAVASLTETHEDYQIYKDGDNIVFEPENAETALIFYPGAKVQYESYAPLMEKIAEKGVLCILVKMPFNMAVFDINAADKIRDKFPEIKNWYVGGHSLGGAMAASYASRHTDEYSGLLLLAAFSSADLSDSNLNVLSIYGSNDLVLEKDKYEKYWSNLPEGTTEEIVIDGGCHSYNGDYGMQNGDGEPTISRQEQMQKIADAFAEFVKQ